MWSVFKKMAFAVYTSLIQLFRKQETIFNRYRGIIHCVP